MEDVFITVPDYHVFKNLFRNKDFVSVEELWDMIEELHADKEHFQEELEDLQNDLESNYVPLKRSDYTGDSRDDYL